MVEAVYIIVLYLVFYVYGLVPLVQDPNFNKAAAQLLRLSVAFYLPLYTGVLLWV